MVVLLILVETTAYVYVAAAGLAGGDGAELIESAKHALFAVAFMFAPVSGTILGALHFSLAY